jgi:hypothetical protein
MRSSQRVTPTAARRPPAACGSRGGGSLGLLEAGPHPALLPERACGVGETLAIAVLFDKLALIQRCQVHEERSVLELRSTNLIERLNSQVAHFTHNVRRWRDGEMIVR